MHVATSKHSDGKNAMDTKQAKRLKILSHAATILCIAMYISYVPEITANFTGNPVSPIQPLVASINACLWVTYGWSKPHKDWPVIIANLPGIFFGLITVITVYIH